MILTLAQRERERAFPFFGFIVCCTDVCVQSPKVCQFRLVRYTYIYIDFIFGICYNNILHVDRHLNDIFFSSFDTIKTHTHTQTLNIHLEFYGFYLLIQIFASRMCLIHRKRKIIHSHLYLDILLYYILFSLHFPLLIL